MGQFVYSSMRACGWASITCVLAAVTAPLLAQRAVPPDARALAAEGADSVSFARIRAQAIDSSRVMEITSWLSDVYGPRLTNSPNVRAAATWAMREMKSWGLSNVHLESWGPFGRGWANEGFSLEAVSPQHYPIIAYPSAWTPGTNGPVTAQAIMATIDSEPDFAKYRAQLREKFVMLDQVNVLEPHFRPDARRIPDSVLTKVAALPAPAPGVDTTFERILTNYFAELAFEAKRSHFLADEGAAAALLDGGGDDGTVFVSSHGGSWDPRAGTLLPTVVLASEHYGRIARTIAKGIPVTLTLNDRNRFYDDDLNSFNVVAEIPGIDTKLRSEVVMVGGHFDSWQSGTGATDNGAGVATMMEALRILKAAHIPLKRTVRIALWTGEEEGELGSQAYVKQHFADPRSMKLEPEHAKFDVYFNLDNGTGKIRGVYLEGNSAIGPIFDSWMTPFKSDGMKTLTLDNTVGTDHQSFDAVGLPGFQFIQDPIDYGTRTHHSNMDVYEHVVPEDMKWNALVVATFVMQAANRAEKLPRKPLPRAVAAADAAH